MSARVFRPKLPKTVDSNISKAGPPFTVEVELRHSDHTLFRRQKTGIPTKQLARKVRDSFFEEFNVLEGGEAYAKTLAVVRSADGPTLEEWVRKCVDELWPPVIPNTVREYEQALRDHGLPSWGTTPLRSLRSADLKTYIYSLLEKRVQISRGKNKPPEERVLSLSSVRAIKAALSSALSLAVEHRIIETNPLIGLKMRWQAADAARRRTLGIEEDDVPSKRLLKLEEVQALLRAAQDSPIYSAIFLQSKLGLRIAEALAVRKSDFDFESNVLRVRKQLKRVERKGQPSKLMLTELKTAKARRDIPLPPSVREWALQQPEGVPLARNEKDGWMEPRRAQELFAEAARKAGLCGKQNLPDPTSHDLRFHWTSRLLNDLNVPVTVVSRLCGHANIETTLKHYSEATSANLADAMSRID